MGRLPLFDDDSGFAHIHSPVYEKFTQHTSETFFMLVDDLENDDGPQLAEKEQVYGLNYEPSELMFCPEVRPRLHWPFVIYYDHMHCLTASGGIAQYIVNQLVLRISSILEMELSDWDEFHNNVCGMQRLRWDFFKTRIVDSPKA